MPARKRERNTSDDLNDILAALPARYIPHIPTPLQAAGLLAPERTILLGGAAGPGKSDWILMKNLQFVDMGEYRSLIVRRTYPQLSKPGGLIERSHRWLGSTDAKWVGDLKQWRFPSGAVLQFGHMEHEKNIADYAGQEYHTIGIDESTSLIERMLRSLYARQRRAAGCKIPLQMCWGSNPGGVSHDFHKRVFGIAQDVNITAEEREIFGDAIFIPGRLADNPHIDQVEYRKSLMHLDPITRQRLLDGDWSARDTGGFFLREWFRMVDDFPRDAEMILRYWDEAGSDDPKADYTAGALMCLHKDILYIIDVVRRRGTPGAMDAFMAATVQDDVRKYGPITVSWEQEPGSSGVKRTAALRQLFKGLPHIVDEKRVNKKLRAGAVSSQAEAGNVCLVNGSWINDFLDEHEAFADGEYDDQVDATSGGYNSLTSEDGYMGYLKREADKVEEAKKKNPQGDR